MSDLDKYKDIINHQEVAGEDELAQFLKEAAKAKVPAGKGKQVIWDQIEDHIDEGEQRTTFKRWPVLGIAASVALIVTFLFVLPSKDASDPLVSYRTLQAEQAKIELPDGSLVEMNANSELTFEKDWNRKVTLTGEAFFEVKEGSLFEVATPTGVIAVLGTSFNVFARQDELEVACKTGKVAVHIPSKDFEEAISPGEAILFKADTVKKMQYIPELIGKWNQGEFYFNGRLLTEVIEELQRQFDIDVQVADSLDQKFTGFFSSSDVETALDMVCLPLDLTYEQVADKNFVIHKNP